MSPDSSLLTANQVRAILTARRRFIAAVASGTLLLTLLVVLFEPRVWTSSSDVYIDYKESDPVNGRSFSPLSDDSYVQTQIDMIRSQAVAEYMIRKLGLLSASDDAPDSKARSALIAQIGRNLDVTGGHGSRVLQVSYSAGSPGTARDYANGIVDAYIAFSQSVSSRAARAESEQYNIQLEQLRKEVNSIQDELTHYQQQTGIVDTREGDDLETRRLNDLMATSQTLQTQVEEARARNASNARLLAQGLKPEDLPQITSMAVVNDLRNGLITLNRELSEVRGALGPNHPTVRGLVAQQAALQARIAAQAKAELDAQDADLERLQAQQAQVQADVAQQREKVLKQMVERDRVNAYRRQLEAAEGVYNAALQKYDDIRMAGNVSQPNLAVLRVAEAPTAPSRPRVLRSLAAGALVGVLAGICTALLLELRQRRVRCADDLVRSPQLSIIGHVGRAGIGAASAGL